MAKKKRKYKLPAIYLDEHLSAMKESFKSTFRTIDISKHNKLKGNDEREYIATELYRDNGIFVTSDREFINDLMNSDVKHAGVVYIPKQMTKDEKKFFCKIVNGFIRGACSHSPFIFRNQIIYYGHDGLHTINGEDKLEFSWDWLSQMMNISNIAL